MELRLLRSFVVLAEELHFGRAAKMLNISQPPLSSQIAQLEAELGILLLERSNRRVALTPAGAILYERARENLEALERSCREAVSVSRGEIGQLSIGVIGSAAYDVLPKILKPFRDAHPHIAFRFRGLTITQQLDALNRRGIDIGLLRLPVRCDGIDVHPLEDEGLMVALRRDHPLAQQSVIAIGDLAKEPLLISSRRDAVGYYDELMTLCHRAGFTPDIACEAQPFSTLVGLVAAGLGIALLPEALRAIHHADVVYRPVADQMTRTAYALAVRSHDLSPAVKAFIKIAQAHSRC